MNRLRHLSACLLLGATLVSGCSLGGSVGYKDGEVEAEYHYDLRADELVQETVDSLNDMVAKVKGEVVAAAFGDIVGVTVGVMEALPADCDVVIVVDNTFSMVWAIAGVQLAVSQAMKSAPDRHYGVVTYRDRGDDYISKTQAPLSADLDAALDGVAAMTAWQGGDFPEFVAAGLDEALKQPWRMDKERHIILIGDAPDHAYTDDPITMAAVLDRANELGVVIHGVGLPCGDVCKEEIGAK
ncbi:vWA domain-containing protein [Sorangium sp. So ce513]|uniref:vWA domain-containing protein n=1 Tax=Sorangium sp. So ce513 TaxID=3133315 RepID=UPI003F6025F6